MCHEISSTYSESQHIQFLPYNYCHICKIVATFAKWTNEHKYRASFWSARTSVNVKRLTNERANPLKGEFKKKQKKMHFVFALLQSTWFNFFFLSWMTPWVKVVQREAWVTRWKGKENYCRQRRQSAGRPHIDKESTNPRMIVLKNSKNAKKFITLLLRSGLFSVLTLSLLIIHLFHALCMNCFIFNKGNPLTHKDVTAYAADKK